MNRDAREDRVEAILVGGSAGAFEPLAQMLAALPAGFRTPLVVVLHQARGRGLLVAALQSRCSLAVREPEDKEALAPGCVFVAPPDYHLLIDAGPSLALSVDAPVNWSRPSIDVLFESAAGVLGNRGAVIVLSGANADGACGARAVADAGGVVLVQDPSCAPQRAMPEAALAACVEARVLDAAGIAEWVRGRA